MKTFKLLIILIVITGTSACSDLYQLPSALNSTSTPLPMIQSGIEGLVTIGPVCPGPVQEGDTSCQDKPYQAEITIFDSNKNLVKQFTTDTSGYFKVGLEPGDYTVHPESGAPLPVAADQLVTVTEATFTKISIVYDSGIR